MTRPIGSGVLPLAVFLVVSFISLSSCDEPAVISVEITTKESDEKQPLVPESVENESSSSSTLPISTDVSPTEGIPSEDSAMLALSDLDARQNLSCLLGLGVQGEDEVICNGVTVSVRTGWARIDCTPGSGVTWNEILAAARKSNLGKTRTLDTLAVRSCPAPPPGGLGTFLKVLGVPPGSGLSNLIFNYISGPPPTLSPSFFAGISGLKKLDLSNNKIVEIHPQLSSAAPNLTQLFLRSNQVTLFPGMFANFSQLEVLELGMNGLKEIPAGTFRGLSKLRLLNIWGNQLTSLGRSSLRGASSLENIDLSHNPKLTFLSPDFLTDVHNLRRLHLFQVPLSSLPAGMFLSTPRLQVFYLTSTAPSVTLPSGLLANLKELRDVRITTTSVSSLPGDLLVDSTSMENLTLTSVLLEKIPSSLWSTLGNLRLLDLSHNKIDISPNELPFSKLGRLVYLDLSHNKISHIPEGLFESLVKLETLKLNNNLVSKVDGLAFYGMLSLRTVLLGQNRLTDSAIQIGDGYSVLHSVLDLETLNLSGNKISTIAQDWRLRHKLKKLDLSNNSFTTVSFVDLMILGSGPEVDLRNNQIEVVDMADAQIASLLSLEEQGPLIDPPLATKVKLSGNPLACDCRNYDLALYAHGKLIREVYDIVKMDISGSQCSNAHTFAKVEPSSSNGYSLAKIDPSSLACPVTDECPSKCQCLYRPGNNLTLTVDCNGVGLTSLPRLPHFPLALYLELDLSNNRLTSFRPPHNANYNATTSLLLSNNNITSLDLSELNVTRVDVLQLDGNNLTELDKSTVKALGHAKRLTRLTVHRNPWRCDCTALQLLRYIQGHISLIAMAEEAVCSSGLGAGQRLVAITEGEACPGVAWGIWASAVIAASSAAAVAALWIRSHERIRLWLFARGLLPPDGFCWTTHDPEDDNKPYDAFISFSHADHKFVSEELTPALEDGPKGLRLCLHYRDWIVGDLIPHQIARSVSQSRRTVIILSRSFLTSVWGRMEFQVSYRRALEEGRPRIIVVLFDDVDPDKDVDTELKAYLQTNTYIKRDDPWFWERLKYALRRRGKQAVPPRRPLAPPILLCPPGKKDIIIDDAPVIPMKI